MVTERRFKDDGTEKQQSKFTYSESRAKVIRVFHWCHEKTGQMWEKRATEWPWSHSMPLCVCHLEIFMLCRMVIDLRIHGIVIMTRKVIFSSFPFTILCSILIKWKFSSCSYSCGVVDLNINSGIIIIWA